MDSETENQPAEISASEWRSLRLALTDRLGRLTAAYKVSVDDSERAQLQKQIDALKHQVQTLAVEESVAQFLEDSERYMSTASALHEELNRDPDAEPA